MSEPSNREDEVEKLQRRIDAATENVRQASCTYKPLNGLLVMDVLWDARQALHELRRLRAKQGKHNHIPCACIWSEDEETLLTACAAHTAWRAGGVPAAPASGVEQRVHDLLIQHGASLDCINDVSDALRAAPASLESAARAYCRRHHPGAEKWTLDEALANVDRYWRRYVDEVREILDAAAPQAVPAGACPAHEDGKHRYESQRPKYAPAGHNGPPPVCACGKIARPAAPTPPPSGGPNEKS